MNPTISPDLLNRIKEYDAPTLFNAMVRHGGLPNHEYTDHTIRTLLPELGRVVGYAVTAEVTTNDDDSPALDWVDYYAHLEALDVPFVAVFKDVDSQPGRGASFGDGMATLHKRLGAVGVIVEGTVRDLEGIRRVGLPVAAWGTVPGHGVFNITRYNAPLTVGQLRIRPGDLILMDSDGCVRLPVEHIEEVLRHAEAVRNDETILMASYQSPDFSVAQMRKKR